MAITSEATVITKWSSLSTPFDFFFCAIVMSRSVRSFISKQRFQVTLVGSILSGFPWKIELSKIAAIKLLAVVIACMSPVKCRLIDSIGTTCAYPPPVAPPFKPKTGPNDGSRKHAITFLPTLDNPSANPIVVVDFPSPAFVGLIAVTNTSFPSGLSISVSMSLMFTLAFSLPYISKYSSGIPALCAILSIGSRTAACAIFKSVFIETPLFYFILRRSANACASVISSA